MFINYVYAKIYKGNKTKDKQYMEKINFIFTKNGFILMKQKKRILQNGLNHSKKTNIWHSLNWDLKTI